MKSPLKEFNHSQKSFLVQMLFMTSFTALTGGTFLNGLAVSMGATDVLVSYISVVTNICGIFVLMFASRLERSPDQKKATIWLTILSRISMVSVVIIPMCVPQKLQLYFFVPIVIVAFTLQGLSTIALNNWLAFYTPTKKRGKYISLRQTISLIASVGLSLLGGRFLDMSPVKYYGFLTLFIVALIAAIVEIIILFRINPAQTTVSNNEKHTLKEIFLTSIKNRPFIRYVIIVFAFYLALYISDSFTFIFMFKYLSLDYTTINLLQMLITLPQVFLLLIWGKISDKYGHKAVLNASIWFFAGETLFLFLTSKGNWMISIPIAFLIAAVANSGFVVSVFNRRYEIIPEKGRIIYDSFFNAAIGIAFILGPFLGGVLRNVISSANNLKSLMEFSDIRLLYAVSTIAILAIQAIAAISNKRKAISSITQM